MQVQVGRYTVICDFRYLQITLTRMAAAGVSRFPHLWARVNVSLALVELDTVAQDQSRSVLNRLLFMNSHSNSEVGKLFMNRIGCDTTYSIHE